MSGDVIYPDDTDARFDELWRRIVTLEAEQKRLIKEHGKFVNACRCDRLRDEAIEDGRVAREKILYSRVERIAQLEAENAQIREDEQLGLKLDNEIIEKLAAENLALHEATRWRDPALEPPETHQVVITFMPPSDGRVIPAYMLGNGDWCHASHHGCSDAIRWMPLPQAPEVTNG